MARMRGHALATLLQIGDSHHCLSLMAAPRSVKFRVAVQVQPGKSGHATITSVLSRPMEANPVTRLRRKELMALASPGKTPSSERQRSCRQKTSRSGCELRRSCFFEMFDLRGKRVRLYAQCAVSARKKNERDTHGSKTGRTQGQRRSVQWREGPILPPTLPGLSLLPIPLPLPIPRGTREIGHGMGWPGSHAPRFRHHHPRLRRHIDGVWSLLAWPWGFAFRHSLEDLHAQLGRFTGTITT